MKGSLCSTAAYYLIAVFSTIQQIQAIPGQLPNWELGGDASSSIVPQVVLKALFLMI